MLTYTAFNWKSLLNTENQENLNMEKKKSVDNTEMIVMWELSSDLKSPCTYNKF